jgi:hypothetical protein
MGNRDGFPAPNQFRSTATETLPAPDRALGGTSVGRGVPALHGLYRDVIADFDAAIHERATQWGIGPAHQLSITWNVQVQRLQMLLETRDVFYGS